MLGRDYDRSSTRGSEGGGSLGMRDSPPGRAEPGTANWAGGGYNGSPSTAATSGVSSEGDGGRGEAEAFLDSLAGGERKRSRSSE